MSQEKVLNTLHPLKKPAWFIEVRERLSTIDSVDKTLASIVHKFETFEVELNEVKDSVNFACEKANEASANATKVYKKSQSLQIG